MHYKLYAMMEVFFHLDRFFGGVSCNARIYHAENQCDMGKYEESGEKSDANGFFAFAVFYQKMFGIISGENDWNRHKKD